MKKLFLLSIVIAVASLATAKQFSLTSPDHKLVSEVKINEEITFNLKIFGKNIINDSPIAMQLQDNTWGKKERLIKSYKRHINTVIESPLYKKNSVIDKYNQLLLQFAEFEIEFRMYDDGLAYRFIGKHDGNIIVKDEKAQYNVSHDYEAWIPYAPSRMKKADCTKEEQLWTDHQSRYLHTKISNADKNKLMITPLVLDLENGRKLCFAEADICDYPGMYLEQDGKENAVMLNGVFAAYPTQIEEGGHGNIEKLVKDRADYIAATEGERTFPWRTMIVTDNAGGLIETDMVFRLAKECQIKDISWIKSGKTTWDWWNNSALFNVDFKAGFNTDTYKYFIDFASQYGLDYILIDEGWFDTQSADIFQLSPELDLKEIIRYAETKNIGVLLWTGYLSFERNLEKAVSHYAKMGIKGFKIDFFNRDDQLMIDDMWKFARICADHKLVVDFHGCSKPWGIQRTYPNVLNYEAVFGLEQMRWSKKDVDMVTHDVILPYTRMVAGPIDYTPGAMRNSLKGMYYPNKKNPMSQGTRAHQVAEYIVFDAPLNMLADSPSAYIKEDETTKFISQIPTTWDNTVFLDGEIGEYIVIAHRKGTKWFIGALNNWEERDIVIDLSKIGITDTYTLTTFSDGLNADKVAEDFVKSESLKVKESKSLKVENSQTSQTHQTPQTPQTPQTTIHLAPGGGWTGIVEQ